MLTGRTCFHNVRLDWVAILDTSRGCPLQLSLLGSLNWEETPLTSITLALGPSSRCRGNTNIQRHRAGGRECHKDSGVLGPTADFPPACPAVGAHISSFLPFIFSKPVLAKVGQRRPSMCV